MKKEVKAAIEFLSASYGEVDRLASTIKLDGKDVADALKEVEAGSVDETSLKLLAKYNPLVVAKS